MNLNVEEIKKFTVSAEISLKNVMKFLSDAKSRVVFVVDESGKLTGSITDGDVRRAILKGVDFKQPISEIMFKAPRFVKRSDRKLEEKVKNYLVEEKLYAIPLLDEQDKIVDVFFWHDFLKFHPLESPEKTTFTNPVVIMAGGKGERLDPFTKILPKPLIPFGDEPIIDKIMGNFNKHGFSNFILTLNYKKEMIKMYFKENASAYKVQWVEEDEYLGTAGGIGLLKELVRETFFVCNCDTIIENDFKNILLWHKAEKALITIIGCHKEMVIPYGILEMEEGCLKAINEKPMFDFVINTGVYIIEPEVLSLIPAKQKLDMDYLIDKVMSRGKVAVYPICEGWLDLGQWKEYKDSLYLLQYSK
ncbi:MAG: sugar phosphate nucleotidyltransferase [Candidatus Omnitrophica bacterium]|nr:sugar phosphate nucleotidyltransferase [Candidatus Omnitrophota bacterium]